MESLPVELVERIIYFLTYREDVHNLALAAPRYKIIADVYLKLRSNELLWTYRRPVMVDYIYLDADERRRFAQTSHEYLIEQLRLT